MNKPKDMDTLARAAKAFLRAADARCALLWRMHTWKGSAGTQYARAGAHLQAADEAYRLAAEELRASLDKSSGE